MTQGSLGPAPFFTHRGEAKLGGSLAGNDEKIDTRRHERGP